MSNPNPSPSPSERKESSLAKILFFLTVIGTLLGLAAVGLIFWQFSRNLPKIMNVSDYKPLTVTRIYGTRTLPSGTKEQVEIGEFFKERRYVIPYEKIPDIVVRAFISAEDDRFFEHGGVNFFSMIRAGIANFRAGHVVQGGSTITQQVAKSLLLTPERSFERKIKEIILASRIEQNLSKQQILYLYLNQIYLGHGAYGIQAASRTYFKKDVSELNTAEAALLAGMPQAPGKYSPLLNSKKAKERQSYVLRRMVENKYITQAEMNAAIAQPLKIYHDENINSKYAAYFIETIRKYLLQKYGEKSLYEDGLTITVPMNPDLAVVADKSLKEGLLGVDKRIGYRGPLQHLKTQEEIQAFNKDYRTKLIERKIQFQLLLQDGSLDREKALSFSGLKSEVELLESGEIYQAVVTGFDHSKKLAKLMIGAVPAELPLNGMLWARAVRDDNNPQAPRPAPTSPSRVFKTGDVIQVSLVNPLPPGTPIQVNLEQDPQIQGALFSIHAGTGEVLAMTGGYDFEKSEFNRVNQALRQPGSAFKPVIYAAALEKGFTPASIIVDSPIVFRDADGSSTWKPNNYEERFYGDTTFRQALIKSRNIPTVKIVQAIQVPFLIQCSKRFGINSQFNSDLSIALGSAAITLFDLTRVFALFPRLGRLVNPIFYETVTDRDGAKMEEQIPKTLPPEPQISTEYVSAQPTPTATGTAVLETAAEPPPPSTPPSRFKLPVYPPSNDPDQVMDPRLAYVMTHLMKEVVTSGTGKQASNLGRSAAGKTGTTNDSMDAWFVGFTPEIVTGVWVGFDNQRSIGHGETGARVALPIWLNFMKEAVKPYPPSEFTIPKGIVFTSIDPVTGKLAPANSANAIKEAFVEGTQPTETSRGGVGPSASPYSNDEDVFREDRE